VGAAHRRRRRPGIALELLPHVFEGSRRTSPRCSYHSTVNTAADRRLTFGARGRGRCEIRYFVAGGMGGGPGCGDNEITQWVQRHFTAQTVGNQTVYDLTAPSS
jgi:hypothetical protein